jgi:predicted branched-subunit amino acid permease
VGLTFYIAWNLFTLAGILLGQSIPHLDQFGLDFSIVATFVALIAPLVRNLATVVCVAVSLFCSVLFSYWHWETAWSAGPAGHERRVHLSEIHRSRA